MQSTFAPVMTLGMALLLFLPGCAAGKNERPYGVKAYEGSMIDSHSHPREETREKLARHFADAAKAGIERVIVMRTPNDYWRSGREKQLKRAAQFPNVTILCSANFVGYIYEGQIERARREITKIREDLEAGRCGGVGEVGLRHYDKRWSRGGGQHEVILDLDHPLVHEVLVAANDYAVPVVLHIEPVYKPRSINKLPQVKRWYKEVCIKYPRVRLVAAHTGMMSPPDLEELLLSCPNLFADVKVLHSEGSLSGFADLYAVNDLDFRFFKNWATMFEKYPDRFIFGSDWKEGRKKGYRGRSYRKHISRVRKMIGSLSPSVQKKLAYSNAKRIFRLP